MKAFVLLLALATQAFAADDTLLTCTRTTFRDLDKIVISQKADAIVVTITDENGVVTSTTQSMDEWNKKEISLTSWYGYTRLLTQSYGQWMIEHYDECSGGSSYVNCQ